MVDSLEPKKKKKKSFIKYHIDRISNIIQQSINRIQREQDETFQMLKILREDGVDANSEQYHLAKELLRSRTRRTIFKRFDSKETRLKWLQWSWQNRKTMYVHPLLLVATPLFILVLPLSRNKFIFLATGFKIVVFVSYILISHVSLVTVRPRHHRQKMSQRMICCWPGLLLDSVCIGNGRFQ